MRMYRTQSGAWCRTQAEGKASGEPFEPIDVPTDHSGLVQFLNSLRANPPEPELIEIEATEEHAGRGLNDIWPGDKIKVYANGQPTQPFMKSRDPAAIFTCTECGAKNHNVAGA